MKVLLFFNHIFVRVRIFFMYCTSTKTTYCNRLSTEADKGVQLSSVKPIIKEDCKNNKIRAMLLINFLLNMLLGLMCSGFTV